MRAECYDDCGELVGTCYLGPDGGEFPDYILVAGEDFYIRRGGIGHDDEGEQVQSYKVPNLQVLYRIGGLDG